jgi:hypothetical protein
MPAATTGGWERSVDGGWEQQQMPGGAAASVDRWLVGGGGATGCRWLPASTTAWRGVDGWPLVAAGATPRSGGGFLCAAAVCVHCRRSMDRDG